MCKKNDILGRGYILEYVLINMQSCIQNTPKTSSKRKGINMTQGRERTMILSITMY